MKSRKIAELSLIVALSLIAFIIELRLPDLSPVCGIKLGLANIFTVCAFYAYPKKEVFLIVVSRIILGAIFSGNLSSIIYSASGAFVCFLGMIPLSRIIPEKYMWLCSIFGAVLHNVGQVVAAFIVTKSAAVFSYLPLLTAWGCVAGLFTGLCATFLTKRIKKINKNKMPG